MSSQANSTISANPGNPEPEKGLSPEMQEIVAKMMEVYGDIKGEVDDATRWAKVEPVELLEVGAVIIIPDSNLEGDFLFSLLTRNPISVKKGEGVETNEGDYLLRNFKLRLDEKLPDVCIDRLSVFPISAGFRLVDIEEEILADWRDEYPGSQVHAFLFEEEQ